MSEHAEVTKDIVDLHNRIFVGNSWKEQLQNLADAMRDATLAEHKSHLDFENELYATLVDPVAEGSIKEAEMRKQLLEQARWYRQRVQDLETKQPASQPDLRSALEDLCEQVETFDARKLLSDRSQRGHIVIDTTRARTALLASQPVSAGREPFDAQVSVADNGIDVCLNIGKHLPRGIEIGDNVKVYLAAGRASRQEQPRELLVPAMQHIRALIERGRDATFLEIGAALLADEKEAFWARKASER